MHYNLTLVGERVGYMEHKMEEYASSFNSLIYAYEVHRNDLHWLRAKVVDLEDRPRCAHKYY